MVILIPVITSPSFVPPYTLPYTIGFNKSYYTYAFLVINIVAIAAIWFFKQSTHGDNQAVGIGVTVLLALGVDLYFAAECAYSSRAKLILTEDKARYRWLFGFHDMPYADITKLRFHRFVSNGPRPLDFASITVTVAGQGDVKIRHRAFKKSDVAIFIDAVAKHAPNVMFGDNIISLWEGITPSEGAKLLYTIDDTNFASPADASPRANLVSSVLDAYGIKR